MYYFPIVSFYYGLKNSNYLFLDTNTWQPSITLTPFQMFGVELMGMLHLIFPLAFWSFSRTSSLTCHFCIFPYFVHWILTWIATFVFSVSSSWTPLFLTLMIFVDTIHHYIDSDHVNQISFSGFPLLIPTTILFFLLFDSLFSLFITAMGFLVSLIINLSAPRYIYSIVDLDSILGLQIELLIGQLSIACIAGIIWTELQFWEAVLRGIAVGRMALLYSIRSQKFRNQILGKSSLL